MSEAEQRAELAGGDENWAIPEGPAVFVRIPVDAN